MGKAKDMWLAEYEDIPDQFATDCARHGEEYAREEAARKLKSLGFRAPEINDHLSMIVE